MKPKTEADHNRTLPRSAQRTLGAAEGVLVAFRHCTLDDAFIDIVQTAKRHNVAPMRLADSLVAIAQNDMIRDLVDDVVAAIGQAWGTLFSEPGHDTNPERTQQPQPTMAVRTSSGPPKLVGRQR